MDIKQLQQRKQQLQADLNACQTKIEAATDTAELDAILADVKTKQEDLQATEERIEALRALDLAASKPVASGPKIEFARVDDKKGGFENMQDFSQAVFQAGSGFGMDDRLAAITNLTKETGSAEGFLVPAGLATQVWDIAYGGAGNIVSLMGLQPTSGNTVPLYKNENTDYSTGGIRAYWVGEGAAVTNSKPGGKIATIDIHKLAVLVPVSDELRSDAPLVANMITQQAGRVLNFELAKALLFGNGVGKPEGFAVSGSVVTQAKETSQTAATINAQNVGKMFGRLLQTAGNGAFWLVNPDTLSQLFTLAVGNQPVWQPNFREAPGGMLFGKPVYFSELCETLGTANDILLINPDGYAGFIRQGIEGATSMHLYFDQHAEAFRWTLRVGGRPYLSAPVNPLKGSSTKSHIVSLATRA